ncbi:MAG: TraB/GumN family protein [Chryseolinea sp.]
MGKLRLRSLFLLLLFLVSHPGNAQEEAIENSVFWQVSGKDLTAPSYLFGTFHLMGAHYIDSLTRVKASFKSCKTVVGEILMDSSLTMKMMVAARLNGTTLDKLLKAEDFEATAAWLKELSGYDLTMFNTMNPITIQIFLMSMLQQKYFPMNTNDTPMDIYFQSLGKTQGKGLVGLESFDAQINALFNQFTPERQAQMLIEFVREKDRAKTELVEMNQSYKNGDLAKLELLLADQTYTQSEEEVMLDNRNKEWMNQLPALMKSGQTFVAVGALHLAGEHGLVKLFRQAGYKVTPLSVR